MTAEPSCGMSVPAMMWSMICVGAVILVTILYVSLLATRIVPVQR